MSSMTKAKKSVLPIAVLILAATCAAPRASAADVATLPAPHVVSEADLQARIDRRNHEDATQRQAIQRLLQRPEVRSMAGVMGLDPDRAGSVLATLSDAEVDRLAAQAGQAGGVGGDSRIVISTTAVIIILLLLILLTD